MVSCPLQRYKFNYPDRKADSKHTLIMASIWSTMSPEAKYPVGGRLVEINYSEVKNWYCFRRYAIDDNNNNHQGNLSYQDTFTPDWWELQHLGLLVVLVQAFNFSQEASWFSPKKAASTCKKTNDLVHMREEAPVEKIEANQYDTPITLRPLKLPAMAKLKVSKVSKH